MKLFIKNQSGQKITLSPSMPNRKALQSKMEKSVFTLGASDFEYTVNDIFAEPTKDASSGWALIVFLLSIISTHLFLVSILLSALVFIMAKLYLSYDTKCADRFNSSIVNLLIMNVTVFTSINAVGASSCFLRFKGDPTLFVHYKGEKEEDGKQLLDVHLQKGYLGAICFTDEQADSFMNLLEADLVHDEFEKVKITDIVPADGSLN